MKIEDIKGYRETYQQWMEKQAEINSTETLLTKLELEATELKRQLDNYRQQQNNGNSNSKN